MPTMPSEFYVPAFAAMGTTIAVLGGAVRVLWYRNMSLSDKLSEVNEQIATQVTRAITINNEALRENTRALDSISSEGAHARRERIADRERDRENQRGYG